jgi:MFS family permease
MALAAFRSVATGPIIAVLPALAGDIAPLDEAGQYMGYNNISTSFSGAFAALLFGLLLTGGGAPSLQNYRVVFFVAAAFFIAGGLLFQVKVTRREIMKNLNSRANMNE